MRRTVDRPSEFVIAVARLLGPQNYLEIGVRWGTTYNRVRDIVGECYAVDPNIECKKFINGDLYCMTSDEFFNSIDRDMIFDLIFIDGLHEKEQVEKDIRHAIRHLSPQGIILLHDMDPPPNLRDDSTLCGTAYQAEHPYFLLPIDTGIGIITHDYLNKIQRHAEESRAVDTNSAQ